MTGFKLESFIHKQEKKKGGVLYRMARKKKKVPPLYLGGEKE